MSSRLLALGLPFGSPAEGFGEIEPTTVSLGGDPTGVVLDVRWRTWGGPRAIAQGQWASRKVEWYFPEHNRGGHHPPGTFFDARYATRACDGS
jgi:hypothetical protein